MLVGGQFWQIRCGTAGTGGLLEMRNEEALESSERFVGLDSVRGILDQMGCVEALSRPMLVSAYFGGPVIVRNRAGGSSGVEFVQRLVGLGPSLGVDRALDRVFARSFTHLIAEPLGS